MNTTAQTGENKMAITTFAVTATEVNEYETIVRTWMIQDGVETLVSKMTVNPRYRELYIECNYPEITPAAAA